MSDKTNKKKTVSFSQFSNWWTCPFRWKLDYIDKLKTFEDNLIMSFGTAIHETVQQYLKTMFEIGEAEAAEMDTTTFFTEAFDREIEKKKIPHEKEEYDGFIEDGKNIISEFVEPSNRMLHFPRDRWELLAIEDQMNEDILHNVNLVGYLDLVLREKMSGKIRIIDFKTSTMMWNNYRKEDFSKVSQLLLYKALYSKKYNIPLSKINVEFFILVRKLYDPKNTRFKQTRLQIFKPDSYDKEVMEVISEFKGFVKNCFHEDGAYNTNIPYPKNPGKNKKNCKFCNYLKNGKCDGKPELID